MRAKTARKPEDAWVCDYCRSTWEKVCDVCLERVCICKKQSEKLVEEK